YVAVARHGRFLMWGFWGAPEHMTDAGRALLANCISYIAAFKDAPIETLAMTNPRDFLGSSLAFMHADEGMRQHTLRANFGAEPPGGVQGDRASCARWWADNRDYVRYLGTSYHDGHFEVDEDAKHLGAANDDVMLLDRAVEQMRAGDRELGLR